MLSSQYVGLGCKVCFTKVSQSFFIIFPHDFLQDSFCIYLSLPWQDFTPVILRLNQRLLKKLIISSICTDESENRLCSTAIMKPRIFSSLCMTGQWQCTWSTASASQLGNKKESISEEAILAALSRKSENLYWINNNHITKPPILHNISLKFPS